MPAAGSKGVQWNVRMKRFMRLLNKNKNKNLPEAQLLKLAGQLCQDLRSVSPSLQKLVQAVMECKHWMHFLTSIHVVRACVFVHIHWGQHEAACRLLEHCRVEEKKELVALWHEIHYHRAMEKHRADSLTPVQKFRCRKRNPPPVSLCPEGLKNRNYPEKVRRKLQRFAAEVTTNPDKKQREGLAQDTDLQPNQVYNWFANYRRRQKSRFSQVERLVSSTHKKVSAHQAKHQPESGSSMPQAADEFHADSGSGHVELSFVPCDPGWEQSAADVDCSAVRTYSTLLNSSSPQTVLGKPQCLPVSMPCLEESQASEHSQVLEDPLSNPVASDTFWAACLLFEFSVGSRM